MTRAESMARSGLAEARNGWMAGIAWGQAGDFVVVAKVFSASLSGMRDGKKLELEVREIIDRTLPASVLSGVCLFQPDHLGQADKLGYEIDHLLHFVGEGVDHLVLIECKAQRVELRGQQSGDGQKQWVVRYANGAGQGQDKFLKSQLERQAQALLGNLFPGEGGRKFQVHGWVVSSDEATPALVDKAAGGVRPSYRLCGLKEFRLLMADVGVLAHALEVNPERLRPLRVMQSDVLRRMRHGLIVPELGHPEVGNGLRYVSRCRERLDGELMRFFAPTRQGRWVINGAAGMGKTVLLAYAATVFATERVFQEAEGKGRRLVEWREEAAARKLAGRSTRRVVLMGLNTKQCEILERECARFEEEFERLGEGEPLFFIRPQVVRWHEDLELSADVLLVDEAHDLSEQGQAKIRDWWNAAKGRNYLVLACDRHQKLRLVGEQATILEGMSFSGCSTRLARNYRSPSPVYGAALALMFRWFGRGGAKVLPSRTELEQAFGFGAGEEADWPKKAGERVRLEMRNDSHPANYWSFTVARHTDWGMTSRWIEEWGLEAEQVLWVRFEHLDADFDHVEMTRAQVRDLCVRDPDRVIDAHIKGREFPVVVIEGMPGEGADEAGAAEVWRWRRRLYLCASRASCFLIFVYPGADGSAVRKAWNEELVELLRSCSAPRNRDEGSSKLWRLEFGYPERPLKPDVFGELEEAKSGTTIKPGSGAVAQSAVAKAVGPAKHGAGASPGTEKTPPERPIMARVAAVKPAVAKPVAPPKSPAQETRAVHAGDGKQVQKSKPEAPLQPQAKACGMSPRMIAWHLKTDAETVLSEAKSAAGVLGLKHNLSVGGDLPLQLVEAVYRGRKKAYPPRKEAAEIRNAAQAAIPKVKAEGPVSNV